MQAQWENAEKQRNKNKRTNKRGSSRRTVFPVEIPITINYIVIKRRCSRTPNRLTETSAFFISRTIPRGMNRPTKSNIRAPYVPRFAKKVVTALTAHKTRELPVQCVNSDAVDQSIQKPHFISSIFVIDILKNNIFSIFKSYEMNVFVLIKKYNKLNSYLTYNIIRYIILLALLRFTVYAYWTCITYSTVR